MTDSPEIDDLSLPISDPDAQFTLAVMRRDPVQTARERYAIALRKLADVCEINAAAVRRGAYPQYPHTLIEAASAELVALLAAMAKADAVQ